MKVVVISTFMYILFELISNLEHLNLCLECIRIGNLQCNAFLYTCNCRTKIKFHNLCHSQDLQYLAVLYAWKKSLKRHQRNVDTFSAKDVFLVQYLLRENVPLVGESLRQKTPLGSTSRCVIKLGIMPMEPNHVSLPSIP